MELEAHIFRLFCSDAETFKNAIFPHNFQNSYPTHLTPEGNRMDFFQKHFLEKIHPVTFGCEKGGIPIFKIGRKDSIFERFSIHIKKSENMSFQLQKLWKLHTF